MACGARVQGFNRKLHLEENPAPYALHHAPFSYGLPKTGMPSTGNEEIYFF
jgi:hypothetical protein